MPVSLIIYSDKTAYDELSAALDKTFGAADVRPYTLSFPNRAADGRVRVRVTELTEGTVMPDVERLAREGRVELASDADPDVQRVTYDELFEGAGRFARVAAVRFLSPTILEMAGRPVPFPVVQLMFRQWAHIWNTFSPLRLEGIDELLSRVVVSGFQVSSERTAQGVGFKGQITMEMGEGASEEMIRRFNLAVDFAFFCGTGLCTAAGLGQTARQGQRRPG